MKGVPYNMYIMCGDIRTVEFNSEFEYEILNEKLAPHIYLTEETSGDGLKKERQTEPEQIQGQSRDIREYQRPQVIIRRL